MADKRMVSKNIIRQAEFMDLPLTAQALYMHLMTEADDDGFVASVKRFARMVGAKNNDLKMLADVGYITLFPSGVAHVTHWLMHNCIKKDRYKETIYTEEKKIIMDPNWNQNGTETEPQNRLDKNRIEKKREEEIKIDKDKKGKDSSEIINYDIDHTFDGYIESIMELTPPPEEELPDCSELDALPEPIVGNDQIIAPTLNEIKEFIAKSGLYLADVDAFYEYYNKHGWDKAKDWKQKILHWHFNSNPEWRRQY